MIKLIAQPHNDTFQVFDMPVLNNRQRKPSGFPGEFLGIISREEVLELFDDADQFAALFDGEHEDLVKRFIKAKNNQQTLFMEAIESVK